MPRGIGNRGPAGRLRRRAANARGVGFARYEDFDELVAVERDSNLLPALAVPLGDAERKVVEQLVGDDDASPAASAGRSSIAANTGPAAGTGTGSSSVVRCTNGPSASSAGSICSSFALGRTELRRPFDEDVTQRGQALGFGAQHLAREPARSRTRLDDEERIGRAELLPPAVERTRDARAEQRPDFGAGDEVAARAARTPALCEEAAVDVVERELHEHVERDRPLAMDPRAR